MECYAEPDTPPGLSEALTDEERSLLRCAQTIADTVLEPRAQQTDQSSEPPRANITRSPRPACWESRRRANMAATRSAARFSGRLPRF
jgi:hypothetical protein